MYCKSFQIEKNKIIDNNNLIFSAVIADLGLSSWPESLIASGFDVVKPTVWLLEGLTGYLTNTELESLLSILSRFVHRNYHILSYNDIPKKSIKDFQ